MNGEEYYVVNSALMLLKILSEYLEVVHSVPALYSEVLNGMTELLGVYFESIFLSKTKWLIFV